MKMSLLWFILSVIGTQSSESDSHASCPFKSQQKEEDSINIAAFAKRKFLKFTHTKICRDDLKKAGCFSNSLDLRTYKDDIIAMLDDKDSMLTKFYIGYFNDSRLDVETFTMNLCMVISSLKLYFDLLVSVKKPTTKIARDILNNNRHLCYRFAIKVSSNSLFNQIKKICEDDALFLIRNDFLYIDIFRITLSFIKSEDYSFPENILEILANIIDFMRYFIGSKGTVIFKPKLSLNDPLLPFCVSLEVDDVTCTNEENFKLSSLRSKFRYWLKPLMATLRCYFAHLNWESTEYSEKESVMAISCKNGFSITCKEFDQGSNLLYMPIFFLKPVSKGDSEKLQKLKQKAQFYPYRTAYLNQGIDFFAKTSLQKCDKFCIQVRNTFGALLTQNYQENQESSVADSERMKFLNKNTFTQLINHEKITWAFTERLKNINNNLSRTLNGVLRMNWEGVFTEVYDLNTMYVTVLR